MNEISWVFFKFFSFKIGHDDEFFFFKTFIRNHFTILVFCSESFIFYFLGRSFSKNGLEDAKVTVDLDCLIGSLWQMHMEDELEVLRTLNFQLEILDCLIFGIWELPSLKLTANAPKN